MIHRASRVNLAPVDLVIRPGDSKADGVLQFWDSLRRGAILDEVEHDI